MGPAPSRFIPYAGRNWAISELARHLGLDPQVLRWRVDHWRPDRWAEPAKTNRKLTAAQAVAIRDRVSKARGLDERTAVVRAIAGEYGMSRRWIGKIGRGMGRKGWE